MPTNINFNKKLGFINGTSIVLPSGSAADFSTKSLFFDGVDDHIETSTTYSEMNGGTKLTLSVWIKPISAPPILEYIISNPRNTTANQHQFALTLYENNNVQLDVQGHNSQYVIADINAITYGAWNHILACVDLDRTTGTEGAIFINGVDETTTSAMGTLSSFYTATDALHIGVDANGGYNRFNGYLDELAIWAGQDLRNDIATIWNNGKPADLTSLNPTSWYRAGESSTFAYPQILMPEDTNKNKLSKYSLDFDGTSDYIDCGDPDEFSFGNGSVDSRFSLSAWIYMDDATNFAIMSKYDTNVEYQFFVTSADRILFRLFSGGSTLIRIGRQTEPITSFENQWIHVAATYDGSSTLAGIKIYLNGNRVDTTDSSLNTYVAMSNTNASFEIGRISAVYANGKIDEAAVFPVELGLSDVQAIYNSGVPTDISSYSPLGYWKLGEEAKFTDNWLVPNSALSNFSKYSFHFDGVDAFVNCGNGASLQITGALTISAWVKTTDTNYIGIYGKGNSVALSDVYFRMQNTGVIRAFINNSTNVTGVTAINDGNWHHVMFVYIPSTSMTIYVDGSQDAQNTTSIPIAIPNNYSNVYIGQFQRWLGNIDEVAVWNSDQSAAVAGIYNGGKPKDLSGLSPVSWWRMGEEATYDGTLNQFTIPDQAGTNNGTSSNTMLLETLVGDTPQYYGGGISDSMDIFDRVGDAPVFANNFSLDFDGVDDYVDCGSFSAYDNGDLSASIWIKKSTMGTFEYAISNSGSSARAGFDIIFQDAFRRVRVGRRTRTSDTISAFADIGFTLNTWHNIAFTYQDSTRTLKVYMDGVLQNTTIGSASTNSASLNLTIGSFQGSSNFASGKIDEVSVFNTELSASDVTSIYNNGVPNDLTSLSPLSWWRFEEGSGTTATDSGSGGNDGTLTNGPLYDTDRILATKANNTVSFNMEEADIVEDTP